MSQANNSSSYDVLIRAVGRSENPGGGAICNLVGIIWPPVEIGLTDLPKSGGAVPPPEPPAPTGLRKSLTVSSYTPSHFSTSCRLKTCKFSAL